MIILWAKNKFPNQIGLARIFGARVIQWSQGGSSVSTNNPIFVFNPDDIFNYIAP